MILNAFVSIVGASRRFSWFHLITTTLFLTLLFNLSPVVADSWQPVEVRSWVQADTPAGWSVSVDKNETVQPDTAKVTAISPDTDSRLTYILEHNANPMTEDEIQQYQSGYMSRLGFRICKTKDPIRDETADHTFFRQTYVRGTDDAAVIGTLVYPEWGVGHFVLVMEGADAVARDYESLPPSVSDHLVPIMSTESTG
ncbi:MAG: hypothetical protein LUQ50_13205 [Methanospirillum sp.]|uniref:hypothetical protein n=1 Tax=Methanospirillum sp. TaxID=45200 RepID=UPI00236F4609|nr:hypothetical protein [Methanospirillum sp.]MDD1730014.1 hypothetical protein [Methanospirillum sp.]